jgi:hypothetical protein
VAPGESVFSPVSLANAIQTARPTSATPPLKVLTVKEILKKYRQALGRSFKKAKITSTVAIGTLELSGIPGTVEIYSKAPDRQVSVLNLNGIGRISEGFDGTEAWSQDPFNGLRVKTGIELVQSRSAALFDRDAQLEKLYPKMETRGTEKVSGRDAYLIVATSPTARSETWYFDAQSFLMVQQDVVVDTPQGKFPLKTFFEDYRLVRGVRIPFVTRAVSPVQTVVIRLTEIKTNVAIDDAKFKKPVAP